MKSVVIFNADKPENVLIASNYLRRGGFIVVLHSYQSTPSLELLQHNPSVQIRMGDTRNLTLTADLVFH